MSCRLPKAPLHQVLTSNQAWIIEDRTGIPLALSAATHRATARFAKDVANMVTRRPIAKNEPSTPTGITVDTIQSNVRAKLLWFMMGPLVFHRNSRMRRRNLRTRSPRRLPGLIFRRLIKLGDQCHLPKLPRRGATLLSSGQTTQPASTPKTVRGRRLDGSRRRNSQSFAPKSLTILAVWADN